MGNNCEWSKFTPLGDIDTIDSFSRIFGIDD